MCRLFNELELQTWLEWAGARLIAMPGRRSGPEKPHAAWPEFSKTIETAEFRRIPPLKASAPSSAEIPFVDEILLLPNICERIFVRRTLHARALVHPVNGRHLFPWTRIAELLNSDSRTIKHWHQRGLTEVVNKTPSDQVCRISGFFG